MGHHDRGRGSNTPGGEGHRLRMVSRRKGHHSERSGGVIECHDGIGGTANFERAGSLKVVRFQQHPGSGPSIEFSRGEQWRAMHPPRYSIGGGDDIGEIDHSCDPNRLEV